MAPPAPSSGRPRGRRRRAPKKKSRVDEVGGEWKKEDNKEELVKEDKIVWGAHHALQQPPSKDPPSVCALLPLFYEKAATPSMIKHGMDVQRQAIAHLSPGQIPATTMD